MAKKSVAGKAPAGHWKPEPDEHDYPAALAYLSLLMPDADAALLVDTLRAAAVVHRKAKDILRASGLELLGEDSFHVAKDLRRIRRGARLSPVLLVRGSVAHAAALTIADGYHRVCASYHIDEDADVPCRLVDLGRPRSARPRRAAAQDQ